MPVGFPTKVNYATGDVLSATNMNDLSGTVNLLESAQYAAGKNKIINGDFGVWQRGTTFTNPGSGGYTADRWIQQYNNSCNVTFSRQTFTPGTAPVAGYEGSFFFRADRTSAGTATFYQFAQRMEDVTTFAGQTVTLSFWAKASSSIVMNTNFGQNFGSGGSGSVGGLVSANHNLTTSWQRFTATGTITSIAGKTIGIGSFISIDFYPPQTTTSTVDVWGVQVEAGSTASPFQTATGTKQGELAACQRYYWRSSNNVASTMFGLGAAYSTTAAQYFIKFPISMRVYPTSIDYSNLNIQDIGTGTLTAPSAITINTGTPEGVQILATGGSGFTQYRPYGLTSPNSTAVAFLGFNAEL